MDMNKLYTELILEKIENEVLGERMQILSNYKDMFNFNRRHKILIKADPGMGKTTLGKKIGVGLVKGSSEDIFGCFLCFSEICTARRAN